MKRKKDNLKSKSESLEGVHTHTHTHTSNFKRRVVIVCVIFILCIIAVVYTLKINKIDILKNIREKNKQSAENANVTVVDVTNMVIGSDINHQHIYKSMYDNTQHWDECTICHEKNNIVKHSITTTWLLGYESCEPTNLYTKICSCGYTKKGHKPCVWDGHSYLPHTGFKHLDDKDNTIMDEYSRTHNRKCIICNNQIQFCYYMNDYGNGEIYSLTMGLNGSYAEYCKKSDGSIITCNNPGTCVFCNNIFNAHSVFYIDVNSGRYGCWACNQIWGTVKYTNDVDNNVPALNKMIFDFEFYDPWIFRTFEAGGVTSYFPIELYQSYKQELTSISEDKKKFTITISVQLKSNVKKKQYIQSYCTLNGTLVLFEGAYAYQDRIKPEIIEISSDSSLTDWSKTKPIIIKGNENYCDAVSVKIVEVGNEENVIFEGGANVVNGKYEVSCIPEIETGEAGKKYKAIVTDTCENSAEKEFEIAKVDSISPEITSGDKVSDEWAKEKLFTFSSVDTGIGQVQIAFNDESDYSLATNNGSNFTREYKFVGDVYQPKRAIVLYKDGLGNVSSKEATIDKLDNTAPTITNVRVHNNKMIVTANDIKEGLGEGSGVVKYKYLASRERITNPYINDSYIEVRSSEEIRIENIAEAKYIYIYAEDLVRKYK